MATIELHGFMPGFVLSTQQGVSGCWLSQVPGCHRYVCAPVEAKWLLQIVAKLKAHTKNVRHLCYDSSTNVLFSVSFDKSLKAFKHHPV